MKQLTLKLKWWYDPELWRERRTGSAVERPTEDEALRNIFYQALSTGSKTRYKLSDFEERVFKLYKHCKAHMPHMNTAMQRYEWVARQMPEEFRNEQDGKVQYSVFRVQAILEDVEHIIRVSEMTAIIEDFASDYELAKVDTGTLRVLLSEMGADIRAGQGKVA